MAHLIEFGSGPRQHKSGKSTGHMPAFPFLRPAWDANKMAVVDLIGAELWSEIERAADRLGKKAAKAAARASNLRSMGFVKRRRFVRAENNAKRARAAALAGKRASRKRG